jgi:hypothetical protein
MGSALLLGFLIGMQHALEADHLAAVATIASRARSGRAIVRHGVVWGLGHSLTLGAVGAAILVLDGVIPEPAVLALEGAVGVMLVLLGADLLRRLAKERVHFHRHRHADGVEHIHAHSHAGQKAPHDPRQHHHAHPRGVPLRSLLVGMMHGLAGSAALLLLALAAVQSTWLAVLYIALFGLGSIVGMAALSAVIAVPLSYSAGALTWANRALQAGIACVTVSVGAYLVYETAGRALAGA